MKLRYLAPFIALSLFGAGCFGGPTTPTGPDGGVWKSADGGQTWVNKKALVTGPKVTGAVASYAVTTIVQDPQDHTTLYMGTLANGLLYSLDSGDSWQQFRAADPSKTVLSTGRVNAVVVDPKNKCTIYATSANKIYKTGNCGRDWEQVFYDPQTDQSFTQLAVDWYNPTILFAGTTNGKVLRSGDSGHSWQIVKQVDGNSISDIEVSHHDSRVVYVGTQGAGIWKTMDSGMSWEQIRKQFGDEFANARTVIQIVLDPVDAKTLYTLSKYGIIKSTDGGQTWQGLNLVSPPGTIRINSLAIDQKNNHRLIFTGVSTLQFSTDGGVTWTPKKLPTTQAGSVILIDPLDSNLLYLATTPPPQKQ